MKIEEVWKPLLLPIKVAVIGGSARANALELSERLVEGKTGDDAPPYVGDF